MAMQWLGEESRRVLRVAYMPRRPSTFRQTDLTRAIKGARNAGVEVARAEIAKDGKITIIIGEAGGVNTDVELTPDDELKRWRRRKNAG
jgi:hypothetical protein